MNSCAPIAAIPLRSVAPGTTFDQNAEFYYAEYFNQYEPESYDQKNRKQKSSSPEHNEGLDDEANYDFSQVPPPVCSCTAIARRCYKCGPGGWQSTCCNNLLSQFPLPLTASGRRTKGRKISCKGYTKVLRKLAREGQDLSQPIDLTDHWGRRSRSKSPIN